MTVTYVCVAVPYPASRPTSLWTKAITPMPVDSSPFLNQDRNPGAPGGTRDAR